MAESLKITAGLSKADIYEEILPQIRALIADEPDLTANLANITAVLTQAFGHLWTGFYLRKPDGKGHDRLVLGPFQGPIACTSIPLAPVARGVCGASAAQRQTIVVPDVDKFSGHIACSSASRSEIVVPLVAHGETQLVLDVDSIHLNSFDAVDATYLERVIQLIRDQHFK